MLPTTIEAAQLISTGGDKPAQAFAPAVRALLAPLSALAGLAQKAWRSGFRAIGARPASIESQALGGFARGMREAGHIEGRDHLI